MKAKLNKKKSDPIMLQGKLELGADNVRTETVAITIGTKQNKNSQKWMQAINKHEERKNGTLSPEKSSNRASVRQKKAPESMSNDFYGIRFFKYR
jgi:hypothetical protein